MKKILFTLLSISFFFTIANADTTLESLENFTPVTNSGGNGNVITDYVPVLDITFAHNIDVTPMQITSDGNYYYSNNGGISDRGEVRTFDLNGNLLNTVLTNLDTRGFFYNPNDGLFYIKDYSGPSLYTVDPANGNTSLVYSGIFHGNQGCLAYDPSTNYMYEMSGGTVYEMDLATGNTLRTLTGFTGSYSMATNGIHLFSYDGSTVYAYDFDGIFEESFYLGSGNFYTLSFCNNLMWYADGGYGSGNYYGFSGVEGIPPSDTCLMGSVTILTPRVADDGGIIVFDLEVRNCGLLAVPVYAEMYPTIGDCDAGTVFDFNMSKQLTPSLDPGETFNGYYFYNVGNVSGMGLSGCALNFDFGPAVDNWVDAACDEFTFYSQFGRSGGVNWGTEWFERGENGATVPSITALGSNYPNPFNATTTIPIDLSASGNVSVKVYNLSGQLVETIADGYMDAGYHTLNWDASSVSSGVYFYVLKTGDLVDTKKMNLLK